MSFFRFGVSAILSVLLAVPSFAGQFRHGLGRITSAQTVAKLAGERRDGEKNRQNRGNAEAEERHGMTPMTGLAEAEAPRGH